jgi:hypothetical protein
VSPCSIMSSIYIYVYQFKHLHPFVMSHQKESQIYHTNYIIVQSSNAASMCFKVHWAAICTNLYIILFLAVNQKKIPMS